MDRNTIKRTIRCLGHRNDYSRIEDLHALKENLLKYKMEQTESCK
jgi:hypothetical protein